MLHFACDACDAPLCERQQLFSLALGYEEESFCPACLAQKHHQPLEVLVAQVVGYVHSRDCFKKPWQALANDPCPLLAFNLPCLCHTAEAAYQQQSLTL
jgi:hypothetical protein